VNIYQKLIEVRKVVPYLQKKDKGGQYEYVGSSDVLGRVRAKMDELGLLIIPAVIGHKVSESTVEYIEKGKYGDKPKKTTTYFTELVMVMKWVNAENPEEFIDVPWYGQGVDIAGEKGVGKALTYAEKYFLLKSFNIATDKDDPDAFQNKLEEQENGNSKITKAQAKAITDRLDRLKSKEYVLNYYKLANAEDMTVETLSKINDWCNKKEQKAS
jgi:hypothetical protein